MIAKKELYKELFNHREREMRTRISLLDWKTENLLRDIEGRVTDGTVSLDGNSPVRRSCALTMVVDKNITRGQERISDMITINKKVKIQIGLKNTTLYKDMGDYIWFNLGVYVLTDVTYMHDLDNATINISALDKMCLWSGDVAGELQQTTDLMSFNQKVGDEIETQYLTYYEMIHRLVTVFGEQNPGKVLINDVDKEIRRVIQKTSPGLMYFSKKDNAYVESLEGLDISEVVAIDQGDYMYVYEPFRPNPEEEADAYTLQAGSTITSALDTIKNSLGNFEYFFDIEGNFIFQEIRNFKNTSFTSDITSIVSQFAAYGDENDDFDPIIRPIQDVDGGDYITSFSKTPYTYSFEDSEIATGFTNTPDWRGIKNNFVVYGGSVGQTMLHVAIDKKPVSPSVWYVDSDEMQGIVMAPEFYIAIRNAQGLWGVYLDNEFVLSVKKLEAEINPAHIFENYILLKDHLTEDYSRLEVVDGKPKFRDEFFPSGTSYNGVILKSQYGCECLLYSYDSYPEILAPYRFLNFIQSPNGTVYLVYPNISDKLVAEPTNPMFFTNIYNPTDTPLPEYMPKTSFLLQDNKLANKYMKIDNNARLYVEDTTEIAIQNNFFMPDLKGSGVNLIIYNDRLQYDKSTVIAVPYNQPWQQYVIDLGDDIIAKAGGQESAHHLLPRWYIELKQFFPLIYKRNDNYWGGNWLQSYTPSGEAVFKGMGDSSIWPYYFDLIDEGTELGKYSINAIGLRTKAHAEEDISLLYPPVRRNYCIVKPSETEDDYLMDWLNAKEQPYLILKEDSDYLQHFSYAAYGKDAFTKLRELIYIHTSMNETVNIASMPLYFLEPNTKIIAKDEETNTSGDYVIMNIQYPLGFNAQQNMACIKTGSRL